MERDNFAPGNQTCGYHSNHRICDIHGKLIKSYKLINNFVGTICENIKEFQPKFWKWQTKGQKFWIAPRTLVCSESNLKHNSMRYDMSEVFKLDQPVDECFDILLKEE